MYIAVIVRLYYESIGGTVAGQGVDDSSART